MHIAGLRDHVLAQRPRRRASANVHQAHKVAAEGVAEEVAGLLGHDDGIAHEALFHDLGLEVAEPLAVRLVHLQQALAHIRFHEQLPLFNHRHKLPELAMKFKRAAKQIRAPQTPHPRNRAETDQTSQTNRTEGKNANTQAACMHPQSKTGHLVLRPQTVRIWTLWGRRVCVRISAVRAGVSFRRNALW